MFIIPKNNSQTKSKCLVTANLLRQRRTAWMKAIGINDDKPGKCDYYVCSNHFVTGKYNQIIIKIIHY